MVSRRQSLAVCLALIVVCAVVGTWCCTRSTDRRSAVTPAHLGAASPDAATTTSSERVASRAVPREAEQRAMVELRALVAAQPRRALVLVERLAARYPNSALADERALLKMWALVNLGEIARARDQARAFYARFPDSRYAARVARLTGYHRRPRPGPPR